MARNESAQAGGDLTQRQLLQSIVEVARGVFSAAAASVFLLDHDSGDLVFEAVAGEGERQLVGRRFPADTGIAGWVARCGQPLLVDDVSGSPMFARDAAESTGYLPSSIMAAPLVRGGECVGVLEVLDRGSRRRGELADVELLGMLATELALALDILLRLRQAREQAAGLGSGEGFAGMQVLERLAQRLPAAGEPVAAMVAQLLAMADQLLAGDTSAGARASA